MMAIMSTQIDDVLQDLSPTPDQPKVENLESLNKIPLSELRDLLKQREVLEIEKARLAIQGMAANLDMSVEDLIGSIPKKREAIKEPAKYRNPDNSSQTWSGRGRKPNWYNDAIGAGTSEESMRIHEDCVM